MTDEVKCPLKDRFPFRCGVSLVSGCIYALAYSDFGGFACLILGILGLLWALQGQHGIRARAIGFIHGMAAYGVGLSWLWHLFGAMSIVLWGILALFTALFAAMQSRAILHGIDGWKLVLFTAVNWSAWEFIRAELFPLKFPWMTAGLGIGPHLLLSWIGVYGVGFLVVFAIAAMVRYYRVGVILLAFFIFISYVAYQPLSPVRQGNSRAVKVAGVQFEGVTLDEFLAATRALPDHAQCVVWPEYAVPYDVRKNQRDWDLIQNLCREKNITLVFGTKAEDGDSWRNIALTVDETGIRGEHTKVNTVHLMDDGEAGSVALPVETKHGKAGTPICFDCDYEGVVRRMVASGAEFILTPIMDAESWTARQHDQHAGLFRIRACENRRWIFVVGSSGVSQLIDPYGRVVKRLDAMKQGTLEGMLARETRLTFYTRYGWLTPWGVLAMACVCWLGLLVRRVGKK